MLWVPVKESAILMFDCNKISFFRVHSHLVEAFHHLSFMQRIHEMSLLLVLGNVLLIRECRLLLLDLSILLVLWFLKPWLLLDKLWLLLSPVAPASSEYLWHFPHLNCHISSLVVSPTLLFKFTLVVSANALWHCKMKSQ